MSYCGQPGLLAIVLTPSPTSWPALVIGLIIAIYWLRVLQMVFRSRQTVGRAANFVPPEPLGRIIRLVWIPVVILWVATPLVTPFLVNPPGIVRPIPQIYYSRVVGVLAALVAAGAFAATWVCWHKMGTSWRMGIDPNERTQLIFTGPYAYVRHPIYALSSLLMLCTMAAVPSLFMLIVGLLHLLFLQWEARREERYLTTLHGPPYADYIAQVGRFCPRSFSRRVPQ
jgi:protein-S-isoprenylcysteine O-methyltransferase Ste14